MKKLDYFTALSYEPIMLSVGIIRKPTLKDVSVLTFPAFELYQSLLVLTPEKYYQSFGYELGLEKTKNLWDSFTEQQKENLEIFDIIVDNEEFRKMYIEMLNYFFVDTVIYHDTYFYVVKNYEKGKEITKENIQGFFGKELLNEVVNIIKEICCIDVEEKETDQNFKNDLARKLWKKMHPPKDESKPKNNINLTIPNVISTVAANSFNLNIIDIWQLTIFQLYDQFNKITLNKSNYVNGISVSVWGDEKGQFDSMSWNKNVYDKS